MGQIIFFLIIGACGVELFYLLFKFIYKNTRLISIFGLKKYTFNGHKNTVNAITCSPDNMHFASAGKDKLVQIWSNKTGALIFSIKGHEDEVNDVAFSSCGSILASASSDGTIKLWNVLTGKIIDTFWGHKGKVTCIEFSPCDKIFASGGEDKNVLLWDIETGKVIKKLEGHELGVFALKFSNNGAVLFSGGKDETIRIWHVAEKKALKVLGNLKGEVIDIDVTCDSKFAAAAINDKIKIIDLENEVLAHTIESDIKKEKDVTHKSNFCCCQFSPDGKTLAAGNDFGSIRFWDIDTWKVLRKKYKNENLTVTDICFSSDNKSIFSALNNAQIKLWQYAGK